MELEEETEEVLERRVRRRLNAETESGLYKTCDGRRLTWRELAEIEDVEVLLEMRGGTKKKRNKKAKNPWNSSESCSGVSEWESEGSSVEAGQKCVKIKGARKSNILLTFGK